MKREPEDEMPEDEMPDFLLARQDEMEAEMRALAKYAANFEALSTASKTKFDALVKCIDGGNSHTFDNALESFSDSIHNDFLNARGRR